MPPSDADLLRESVRRPEAFGEFYDRHAERLLAFCARRTWDAQEAADLTAETFGVAFRQPSPVPRHGRAGLRLARRHRASSAWAGAAAPARRRSCPRRLGIERVELDDVSLTRIEELADLRAMRPALTTALEQLPQDTARAVALRVTDELPYVEVAQRLGCSEGAARIGVMRGLDRLADLLEAT